MAHFQPFNALRPPPKWVEEVSCVPYDVVDTEEARTLASGKAMSFLRVTRSEIEFSDSQDPYSPAIYDRARENFKKLIQAKALEMDSERCFYIYRIQMGGHSQTGIVGCSSVEEYDNNLVKKHEKTREDKENDRTRHILAIGAQSGPVFLTYKARPQISALVAQEIESQTPLYDFEDEKGVRHIFWKAKRNEAIQKAFQALSHTYIADGHHRAASAARACHGLRDKNPNHTGKEDYNFFLSVLFPHSELKILAYNRVLKKLPDLSENEIFKKLKTVYQVSQNADPVPSRKGHVSMYFSGKWFGLSPLENEDPPSDPVAALEVSRLYDKALAPIFGIGDPRKDKNIDFVGGIRGTKYLEELVDSKTAVCAFSVYPTSIDELMTLADQDLIMAPKSTWFEPKLRSGVLIHKII
jgi:uncharacterized protein (DUF1015 family)